MKVPEKHRAVAHKWVDGAGIQYRHLGGKWIDIKDPHWCETIEYRVRPKMVMKWQWIYQVKDNPTFYLTALKYKDEEVFRQTAPQGLDCIIIGPYEPSMIEVEE